LHQAIILLALGKRTEQVQTVKGTHFNKILLQSLHGVSETVIVCVTRSTKLLLQNQIASHPSIYVLDTPGVFPAEILDAEVCSNLALTGTISKTLSPANFFGFSSKHSRKSQFSYSSCSSC